jgi:hypothetical protein
MPSSPSQVITLGDGETFIISPGRRGYQYTWLSIYLGNCFWLHSSSQFLPMNLEDTPSHHQGPFKVVMIASCL